jgi:polyisoprenyl-teichoic acid--peptidoglycan teichoic acid transferase
MKTGFKISPRTIIIGVIAIVLFIGAFALVRYLTVTMRAVAGIPGVSIVDNTDATPDASANLPTPVPEAPSIDLPPTWDGASRVTILLMGVDTEVVVDKNGQVSPDRVGPARSDTMILLTIDPQSKTAGMMSIPRDLWVNIPGYGYARINTAYYNGEANKLPGGGPALAMKTVEQVIGVPVQYYAQMEFWAFTRLVEDMGKVNVFIDKKIIIDPMGPGADKIMLSAGWHKLGGVEALGYVRQRHTEGGDVDRSKRQQNLIMAVRDHVMNPANFPTLLANAPAMYNEIQSGVRTNLTFDDIMRLGMLAKDIPPENIKRGVIDYTMVKLMDMTVNGEKQSVFKPISDKIRVLRDEIFNADGAIGPLAGKVASTGDSSPSTNPADLLALAKQEGATVIVLNGSKTNGLAQRTSNYLKSQGINVISIGNAQTPTSVSLIIDHRGKVNIIQYLKDVFKLNAGAQFTTQIDAAAAADIEIIVGDDWAATSPMP